MVKLIRYFVMWERANPVPTEFYPDEPQALGGAPTENWVIPRARSEMIKVPGEITESETDSFRYIDNGLTYHLINVM